jgi:hypothetical protein
MSESRREPRYRVRPWRHGDKPACHYATRRRRFMPACTQPVAVVTTSFTAVGRAGPIEISYAVCEPHRQSLYDGRPPSRRYRQAYAEAVGELIAGRAFADRVKTLAGDPSRWEDAT